MKKFIALVALLALALPVVAAEITVLTPTKLYDLIESLTVRVSAIESKLAAVDEQHSAELESLSKAVGKLQKEKK